MIISFSRYTITQTPMMKINVKGYHLYGRFINILSVSAVEEVGGRVESHIEALVLIMLLPGAKVNYKF